MPEKENTFISEDNWLEFIFMKDKDDTISGLLLNAGRILKLMFLKVKP